MSCIYSFFNKNYFIFSVPEPETEEDLLKKDARNKMKEEYYFAIQEEGNLLIYIEVTIYILRKKMEAMFYYIIWNKYNVDTICVIFR